MEGFVVLYYSSAAINKNISDKPIYTRLNLEVACLWNIHVSLKPTKLALKQPGHSQLAQPVADCCIIPRCQDFSINYG